MNAEVKNAVLEVKSTMKALRILEARKAICETQISTMNRAMYDKKQEIRLKRLGVSLLREIFELFFPNQRRRTEECRDRQALRAMREELCDKIRELNVLMSAIQLINLIIDAA